MASRGYDMTPTMYSPDGRIYQVEYAIETVNRGTLAIGLRCKDGVLVAVEEAPQALQTSGVTQKIFQVDKHIGIAAAGYIPDARIQVNNARYFSQGTRITYDESVEVETVAKYLADQCHQFTQYSGVRPYGVALIIAGVDQKGNSVYVTDPSGTYVPYAAIAIGAGSQEANAFLETKYDSQMSMSDAAALAIAATNRKKDEKTETAHIKMAMITSTDSIMQKINKEDIEKYSSIATDKFGNA
ncbi:MAG: proteasome subunit alpha [Cenarchaeum symbiont of Oopsacas minuta]|nr:proteasome subunit alpha [Cenarchaeum symbiont of Oopsacas minuta]